MISFMTKSICPTDPDTPSPQKEVDVDKLKDMPSIDVSPDNPIPADYNDTTDTDNEHRKQCLTDLVNASERKYGLLLNGMKMPHESTDHLCRRYLVSSLWDTNEAIKDIGQTIAWRKEERISDLVGQKPDDILGCSEIDVLSKMPMWWTKQLEGGEESTAGVGDTVQRDLDGRPVCCYDIGGLDVRGLMKITDIASFLRYIIWRMERTLKIVGKSHDRDVEKFVMVIDLKGLGLFKHLNRNVMDIVRTLNSLGANHYPETLHRMFFVNTPKFFLAIWVTVRQLINPQTRAKIAISGVGESSSSALLVYMAQDVVDSVLRQK